MFVVGTMTSLAATALVGYLGIIGVLPAVQHYMEGLPVTQRLLDTAQGMRVKPMLAGKFNVLVADLDGDNRDGRNTAHVMSTLADQFDVTTQTSPIRVQRAYRVLRLPPAPDTATANKWLVDHGRKQLERFNADLMVWGGVARGTNDQTVLRLKFLQRGDSAKETQTGSYSLGSTLELPESFGSDLATALAAQVAADAAPAYNSGRHVVAILEPVLLRLRALAKKMPKALSPDQRGGILSSYARVAKTIGDQKGDKALFHEAFDAYRSALNEWTKETNPTQWAITHQNLGDALGDLARIEGGTTLIEDSISAQRKALTVLSRDTDPYKWARAQHSLCIALRRLAVRETDASQTENHKNSATESETTCRAAIEIVAKENDPGSLAPLQGNLGATLILVGRRSGNLEKFKEGIDNLQAALKVITRKAKPLAWARGKHDIGIALYELGERQNKVAPMQEAATYLRASLEELTLEKVPTYWADARVALAEVLVAIGKREFGTANLKEANSLLRQSIPVIEQMVSPRTLDRARFYLANSLLIIGQREPTPNQSRQFTEALDIFEKYVAGAERSEVQLMGRPGKLTAEYLASLAWYAIHAKAFERAVVVSERAATLTSEAPWMTSTRAHSYMFANRTAEAKSLFLSLSDTNSTARYGAEKIRGEFQTLRQSGLTHPLMLEMETEFNKQSESLTTGKTR